MVNQIKSLDTNKPYTITFGGRKFTIKSYKDIMQFLRIRDGLLKKRKQMRRKFVFVTDSTRGVSIDIGKMVEQPMQVSYRTFFKHVDLDEVLNLFNGLYSEHDPGLTLKKGLAVSYFRSKYRGGRCYYLLHRAIEYIFVEKRTLNKPISLKKRLNVEDHVKSPL